MAMSRWVRGLAFVAGSVVAGLAIASLIVMFHPEIIRPPASAPVAASAAAAVPARVTYADAVQRAAAAVVNIYTARVITEHAAPAPLENDTFRDIWPRYLRRVERSLGSGVIVDTQGHIVTNHHVIH